MRSYIASVVFVGVLAVTGPAPAAEDGITQTMIEQKFRSLEKALNNRGDAMAMIRALHDHVSEDARFRLTVSNPQRPGGTAPALEMDKQAYINTYLEGANYVSGYRIDIKTDRFELDRKSGRAVSHDIITERGAMVSDQQAGQPFLSRTRCRTEHELRGKTLVTVAGECHTDIIFEEDV